MSEGNGAKPPTEIGSYLVGDKKPPVERQFGQPNGNPVTRGGAIRGEKKVKQRLANALKRYIRDHPGCEYEIAGALIEEARTRPEVIVEGDGKDKKVRHIGGGWAQAQKLIWDRRDGLLTQKHEHAGSAVQVNLILEGK